MDDHASPNPLLRRKSIAGPFMRASTGISAEHRPEPVAPAEEAQAAASTIPPPLTRANTVSGGGWFGGWFSRRTSMSSSTGVPRPPDAAAEDNYAHLAQSAPQVLPKAESKDSLFNSAGGPTVPAAGKAAAAESGNAPPPLKRRLSEVALKQQGRKASFHKESTASPPISPVATSPTHPSLLETDIRQGPIETDLFWLVLRDIGE